MRLPSGFRAGGLAGNLKRSGRPDLGVVLADFDAVWAFTGTTITVRAPCVERNRRLLHGEGVRAVVVNSGQANCATGEEGALNNEEYARMTARALQLPSAEQVLTASTGVVGVQLPMEKIADGLPRLAEALGDEIDPFARAIVTTDTVTKQVALDLPGGGRIVGVAKGSGMIHPNMATMLSFVFTDVAVSQEDLRRLWSEAVERSFNQVTVDGDTSPNDMAMVLSSGRVQVPYNEFAAGVMTVCRRLARMIARDGEGATRLLTVRVDNAQTGAQARAAARTIAGSPLVKSAVHGRDPNWGRILVALGRSGAKFDPTRVTISVQGTKVYSGAPVPFDAKAVSTALSEAEVTISVGLDAGDAGGEAWGCDLSAEYVRINADYTT